MKEEQMEGPVNCNDSELSIYLQALAEGFLPTFYSDTSQCAQSRLMSIASKSYRRGKQTVLFHGFPSLQMSQNLTDDRGAALLMSFVADSRAKTSAPLEMVPVSTANAQDSGEKWPALSARYDLNTSSWKTAHCLWDEDLPWSSVTLPTWGMTRSGSVYRHPTAARPISATGAGLWRTPSAHVIDEKSSVVKLDGRTPSDPQVGLADQVMAAERRLWPSPNACKAGGDVTLRKSGDGRSKPNKLGWAVAEATWPTPTATASKGWSPNHNRAHTDDRLDFSVERESFQPGQKTPPKRLNPDWVEWLMGWPIGHTDLKPLATDKFREWQQQHGSC